MATRKLTLSGIRESGTLAGGFGLVIMVKTMIQDNSFLSINLQVSRLFGLYLYKPFS